MDEEKASTIIAIHRGTINTFTVPTINGHFITKDD
jgi:hypothetical protein